MGEHWNRTVSLRGVLTAVIFGVGMICILGTGGGGSNDFLPAQYRINGTVRAPENMLVDSDVNDPNAPYEPNDDFNAAQKMVNPAIVGGYVNLPGTGHVGRSHIYGDLQDTYRATLAAGQTVTLVLADPSPDGLLNLLLFSAEDTSNPAQSATDVSSMASVSAGDNGDFYIVVQVQSGYANYNLSIGQSVGSLFDRNRSDALPAEADFVPGQVIVGFKSDSPHGPSTGTAAALGMQASAGHAKRPMLMNFSGPGGRQKVFNALGMASPKATDRSFRALSPLQARRETLEVITALRQRPDVLYAEPNYIRSPTLVPNDDRYASQWHYPLINLPQAWELTTGSDSVIVAVIDTGVLLDHPDLQGKLTDGYDFISDPAYSLDGDGIDANPDDPGDQQLGGSSFHGTHVAGTVGALSDNGTGVAGVAWSARIMPLRALGLFGGTSYDIQQAILYAAGLDNDSGDKPSQKADIINMSLGGAAYSAAEQSVINQARNQGVIIVAAAGNESTSTPSYPAAYNGVVSVSAVDLEARLSWYSNFGQSIDIAAPGGDTSADRNNDGYPDGVLSTAGDDKSGTIKFVYRRFQGTSMAAPHVAGVAALMKALYPQLNPSAFDIELEAGRITEDLGPTGRDNQFGHGMIDALKAVQEAQRLAGGGDLPAIIVADPSAINIGSGAADVTTVTLNIANGGQEDLIIDSVTVNSQVDGWITVTPQSVDANGLGTYRVNVDKTSLALGLYSATIAIASGNTSDVAVPVTLRNGFFIGGGNSGYHYITLMDARSNRLVTQVEVGFSSLIGGYPFEFTGIAPGQYLIFAGTDLDNDYRLGDGGESFGAYLTIDHPTTLNVSESMRNLDFNTGFDVSLPSAAAHALSRRPANWTRSD